jgi:spore coat protein CotF
MPGLARRLLGPKIIARLAKLQQAEVQLVRMMLMPKIMTQLEKVTESGSAREKLEAAKLILNEQKADIVINNGVNISMEPSPEIRERYGKRLEEVLAKTLERNPRARKVNSQLVGTGDPFGGDRANDLER